MDANPLLGVLNRAAADAPRRRGRPPRSLDAAAQTERVALDEFAAARAYLQGLPPREACQRFLVREEPPSGESPALKRLIAILSSVAHAAEQRRGGDAGAHLLAAEVLRERAKEAAERRGELLRVAAHERRRKALLAGGVRAEAPSPAGGPAEHAKLAPQILPDHLASIDSFCEWYVAGHGDPGHSEDEWLAALQDAVDEWRADHRPAAGAPVLPLAAPLGAIGHVHLIEARAAERPRITAGDRSLAALEQCRGVIAALPCAADLVDAWFTPTTAARLRAADLPTLYTLVALANRRGRTWWRAVRGLGPVRAERINGWLRTVGVEAGLPLHTDLSVSIAQVHERQALALARSPQFDQLAAVGLEPLAAALQANAQLACAKGSFQLGNNMLGAANDIEAIVAAIGKYADSPLTQRLYAVEITRFALWCWRELRKALSSVTVLDARAYRAFLAHVPSEWINPDRVPRTAATWRPFRGQLGPGSQRKALTAVGIVMAQLHQTGYLVGNPFAGAVKASKLPAPRLDITRSFGPEQWALVLEMLDREPGARRLAALDRLALRDPQRAEALLRLEQAKARRLVALVRLLGETGIRRDELHTARLGALALDAVENEWTLRVRGKRDKEREVYVPREVLDVLRAHLADRPLAGFADDVHAQAGREQIPFISAVAPSLLGDEQGDPSGALGPDSIYRILKRFFAKCGDEADRRGLDGARFRAGSTHWLRHTFGTLKANAGTDPRVLQQALGHSSIATTGRYLRTDVRQMIRGLKAAETAAPPQTPQQ